MAKHMYSQEEKAGLVSYVNKKLNMNIDDQGDAIFELIKPGVLLCNLVNAIESGTIENKKFSDPPKNQFEMNQNHDAMLAGAKKIGCNVVNIGAADLTAGTKHLVLGIFWQVVRYGLLKEVSELAGSLLHLDPALPPEQILLMWLNHHLKASGVTNVVVTNFGEDLADGAVLTRVMNQVAASEGCDLSPLNVEDRLARAELVLQNADKIGCRKFVGAKDIAEGNSRLLLAFVAGLFSKYPSMGPSQEVMEWKQKYTELRGLLDSQTQEWTNKESTLKQTIETVLKEKETALHEKENALKDKETVLKEKETVLKEKEVVIKEKETVTIEKEDAINSLQSKVGTLNDSLAQVTTIKDTTTQQLHQSQEENASLKTKLQDEIELSGKLKNDNTKLEQELAQSKELGNKLQAENEQLKTDLHGALEQITTLQKTKAELEEDKDRITKLKKKINKEKKALNEQLIQAQNKIKVQEEMIGVLNETVKEFKGQLDEEKKKLDEEKKKVDKLTKENKDKDDEIAKLKARIAELEAELEAAKARIKELEKQLAIHLKIMEGSKKEGWLQKLSPAGNKRLQRRWFVLKGVVLSYRKNDKESSKPLGSIDVTKSRVYSLTAEEAKKKAGSGSTHAFEITFLDRGYVLVASSEQEKKDWVEAISKAKVHSTVQENIVATETPSGFDNDDEDD